MMVRVLGVVTILLAKAVCASPPPAAHPTSTIDPEVAHAMAHIKEPTCEAESSIVEAVCEVISAEDADIERLASASAASMSAESRTIIEVDQHDVRVFSPDTEGIAFVCCDIQSMVRVVEMPDGSKARYSHFRIPPRSFLEIDVLGVPGFAGPRFLHGDLDPWQTTYLEIADDADPIDVETFRSTYFDRDILIYRSDPQQVPRTVLYATDGRDVTLLAKALKRHHERAGKNMPSVALVGLASGDNDVRLAQYMRFRKGHARPSDGYLAYSTAFRDRIVPEIEAHLGFDGDRARRILFGKSAGAAWVLSFALENPTFASRVWAASPAGDADLILPNDVRVQEHPMTFSIAVGSYEGAFRTGAEEYAASLRASGHAVNFLELPSGHNFTTWIPAFLRFVEKSETAEPAGR